MEEETALRARHDAGTSPHFGGFRARRLACSHDEGAEAPSCAFPARVRVTRRTGPLTDQGVNGPAYLKRLERPGHVTRAQGPQFRGFQPIDDGVRQGRPAPLVLECAAGGGGFPGLPTEPLAPANDEGAEPFGSTPS